MVYVYYEVWNTKVGQTCFVKRTNPKLIRYTAGKSDPWLLSLNMSASMEASLAEKKYPRRHILVEAVLNISYFLGFVLVLHGLGLFVYFLPWKSNWNSPVQVCQLSADWEPLGPLDTSLAQVPGYCGRWREVPLYLWWAECWAKYFNRN